MKIGEKTLRKGGELLTNSLLTYEGAINDAYRNAGEKEMNITLGLKIFPGPGNGNFKLTSKIKFMLDQIEDTFSDSVDEMQTKLPLDEPTKACPLMPEGDEVFVSVCKKCKDRESTILVDGISMPVWLSINDPLPDDEECYQMIQYMPCRAWADEDYKAWCDEMIQRAIVYAAVQPTKEDKPKEPVKNTCGFEVINGICTHLIMEEDGVYKSACSEPEEPFKDIECCRQCKEADCNTRCANSVVKAKKHKKIAGGKA